MFDKAITVSAAAIIAAFSTTAIAADKEVSDEVINAQRAALADATKGLGFGPQSPRDLTAVSGENPRVFEFAPAYTQMNLCNIHFHEGAEHRGGQFTKYAGNGDGKGHGTGFLYSGDLTPDEIAPVDYPVGKPKHGALTPGDTIEIHYVHSTAPVEPGATLGACLSDVVLNPQLRVEAQVFVLVNDDNAANFVLMNSIGKKDGFHQAINLPNDSGTPIVYAGSTTGPSFNQAGSPLEVTWSVRPEVIKVNIASVAAWLNGNPFDEDHAHGVRNLVTNPDLLSNIGG